MPTIKTPIIPVRQTFAKLQAPHELNKEAICVYMALGFFLDRDTYWKDEVVLPPASYNELDANGFLLKSTPYFSWHYDPKPHSFEDSVALFTATFEDIINTEVGDQKVILPLSGGLDSRSQAVALKHLNKNVHSYSYKFDGGYPETAIAKKIASSCQFPFEEFTVSKGYLWNTISELVKLNNGYSEFSHPRQMVIHDQFERMGDVFSLGHWGDVLFDHQTKINLSEEQELALLMKKVLKKGGLEIATALWDAWGLNGNFKDYLEQRLAQLLSTLKIENSSAKIRAFKSTYWAPRWTSVNLSVFESKRPVTVPYYHNRMCELICALPEEHLADRKIQIQYIKNLNPEVAKIPWQSQRPFNLYTFPKNKSPYNLPYRIANKAKRELKSFTGNPYIQRNWELQFVGAENEKALEGYLNSKSLSDLVPAELTQKFYTKFKTQDAVQYSHPVSMLLTLAAWKEHL